MTLDRDRHWLAARVQVLRALEAGPLTTREVKEATVQQVRDAWATANGITVAWGTSEEPVGASLLALGYARDHGLVVLDMPAAYARLRSLEREGFVVRFQLPGHRTILWRGANIAELVDLAAAAEFGFRPGDPDIKRGRPDTEKGSPDTTPGGGGV